MPFDNIDKLSRQLTISTFVGSVPQTVLRPQHVGEGISCVFLEYKNTWKTSVRSVNGFVDVGMKLMVSNPKKKRCNWLIYDSYRLATNKIRKRK